MHRGQIKDFENKRVGILLRGGGGGKGINKYDFVFSLRLCYLATFL